jgi:hemolysin III
VAIKLASPRRYELGSTAVYLVMGWAVIMFMQPLVAALDRPSLILLLSGGMLYTIGACVHHWRRLPFHNAIWHSLVLSAAGLHYAAIVHGIILPASAS